MIRAALVTTILLAAAPASAQLAPRPQPVTVDVPVFTPPSEVASSRLIYMHRCPQVGCIVRPGAEDSRSDTSSIPDGQVTLAGFKQTEEVWQAVMKCMRETYAPFNIGVTDVDPGNVPHYENMVGGRATELRSDLAGAGGVAPFTCAEIPNAISFTFDVYGPDAASLCWTAAQETAHAFGLEHEYNAADPMTYLNGGPSQKRFQATDSPCGEFTMTSCRCTSNPTQNSYKHILDMFGPGAPTAPTVAIKSPADGKKVQPGFVVRVNATDDVAIDRVELWVDGANSGASSKTAPYVIKAPNIYDQGPHTIEIKAFDVQGTPASDSIAIDMGPPCTASNGCSGTDACVMGVCLPGPEQPGGLGSFCQAHAECLSNQCLADNTGTMACVENCDMATAGACPEDFSCIAAGDHGVCWQTGDGGCCSVGTNPAGPALLGFGVLALVFRPRRRRR